MTSIDSMSFGFRKSSALVQCTVEPQPAGLGSIGLDPDPVHVHNGLESPGEGSGAPEAHLLPGPGPAPTRHDGQPGVRP